MAGIMTTGDSHALSWIGLSRIPGVGRISFRKLISRFGSPEQVLAADREALRSLEWLPEKAISEITASRWRDYAEREIKKAHDAGVQIITADDDRFPAALKDTPDPPLFLYVRGSLRKEDGIAVVGTRKPTHYGLTITHRIAYDMASTGFSVISGLARGIDTQAHKGALAAKGRTIAVLGCGIDIVYPPENKGLLQQIVKSGAVVTENGFGTKPEPGYFPARNRIISGLSRGRSSSKRLKTAALLSRPSTRSSRTGNCLPSPAISGRRTAKAPTV
jgi:DNA processing protein